MPADSSKSQYHRARLGSVKHATAFVPVEGSGDGNERSLPITCVRCGENQGADQKFCVRCGGRLWRPCLDCGAECFVGSAFCGKCGTNVMERERGLQTEYQGKLRQAERLVATHEYPEARWHLELLLKGCQNHLCLEELASQAEQLLSELSVRQRDSNERVQDLQIRAEQLFADGDYQAAATALQSIPESLRDATAGRLLESARNALAEEERLRAKLHEPLPLTEMAQVVDRLVVLSPQDEAILKSAAQLRDQLCQQACHRAREGAYDEAMHLIGYVPPCAADERSARLVRQVKELHWMHRELRSAPLVTRTLLEAAARLLKVAPQHADTVRIADELRQRLAALSPATERWAAPPTQPYLGLRVHPWGPLRHITGWPKAQTSADLNRYYVACGCALQGVAEVSVDTGLTTDSQRGLVQRLSALKRRRHGRMAWGLDAGDASLKIVKLTRDDDRIAVGACAEIPYGARPPATEDERHEEIRTALRIFRERYPPVAGEKICVSWPGLKSIIRSIDVPNAQGRGFESMLRFEARHQLPMALEDLVWDYHVCSEIPAEDTQVRQEVVLFAVKRRILERFVAALRETNLIPDVVQVDGVALHNLLHFDRTFEDTGDREASRAGVLIMDFGARTTNLVFSHHDSVWYRSLGNGGDGFTQAIVRHYKLTVEQAERLKRAPHRVPRFTEFEDVLAGHFRRFIWETQRTVEAHVRTHSHRALGEIRTVGGAAQTQGLLRHLLCGE